MHGPCWIVYPLIPPTYCFHHLCSSDKLIIGNVDNKNSLNNSGETPKDLADQGNHPEISQLFES